MRRRRRVDVTAFDPASNRWVDVDAKGGVAREALTVTTFNVWFDSYFAEERYGAIAQLLSGDMADVMVFQEVTPAALAVFHEQPWIREHYFSASMVGGDLGNYGMLMLSRLPVTRASYTALPTKLARGFLAAEFTVDGTPLVVCSVHLESGKRNSRLRARQLRTIFRAMRSADDAILLGDFNMRDAENPRIGVPYRDVWLALRPDDAGFTEDTTINLMRFDSKNKHRQVRFDRVLTKGSSWSALDIELFGTEPVSPDNPRVFPSDHFGVRCRLVRVPRDQVPHRRRRRWARW
jgi:tyrosyl-DNA phosphodiesterase 2